MKKATEELLNELKEAKAISEFTSINEGEFENISLTEILAQMLEKYKKARIDVIKAARFDYTYGYQIFDGKKRPKREKLLQMAFGFPLSLEDTNRLLRAGGVNGLYVRCKRDVICMYCLHKGMSLEECNSYLYQLGEETLIEEDNDGSEGMRK
ncbi:MAG: hypothetical protein J6C07_07600 [Lachnospiraceae bacterium]|nr:hypothetical protein [Lachnospiraceae bacterium]